MRCDGHRPSCDNCIKKASEPCSYVDVVRRRGPGKKTKGASAREKVSNKRTREMEKEQKKKEEEEAKRLEELRKQEKETRDADIERGLVSLRDTLTRMLSPEQDTRSGQSQLVLPRSLFASPSDAPERTGDRLNLFSALSPLSPSLPLPSAPGDLSSLRMPEPMSLGLPDDLQTSMQSPLQISVPELMDVRMASPPAMSPTFMSHSPPTFPSEMLFTQTSLSRPEPQPFRSRETRQDSGNLTAQQPRQGQLGDLHVASSSSGSRSFTRMSREVSTQLPSVAREDNASRGPSSSHASSSRAHAVGARSASGPMPIRDQPSTLLSRSASVRNAPSSSGQPSHTGPLNTIPTPTQLLTVTSSRVSTTVPSQARATEILTGSLPMLTPEQVEAIARQALEARGGHVGTASASTLTTSETVRQSSEDDTNKGKRKHTRTRRRREGGDPSPSSDSIPNVPIPTSEASTSQSAQAVPTIGSVSEAHLVNVSTRQLENMRRKEGHGRPQIGLPPLPRPGDDSRVGDNYGSSSSSNRPSSSRITIGQRRGRDDSFRVYYGGYEAHEGDPVSGERPSKRAKEDIEDDRTRSEHDTRVHPPSSSSSVPFRTRRAGGAQMGEAEDTELEDGEIRETAADPSTGKSSRP